MTARTSRRSALVAILLVIATGIVPVKVADGANPASRPVRINVRHLAAEQSPAATPRVRVTPKLHLPSRASGHQASASAGSPPGASTAVRSAVGPTRSSTPVGGSAPTGILRTAPQAAALSAPYTAFTVDSGYVSTFTSPPDTLNATYDGNMLNFTRPDSFTYFVTLAAPPGQPLGVGTYAGAVPVWQQTAGVPGIDTDVCFGSLGGSFTVSEASYASDNSVLAFAATYHIQCSASQDLWGELRYGSSVGFTSIAWDSANNLQFWGQRLGTTSTPHVMPISNTGSLDLTFGALSIEGSPDFKLVADTCSGATVAPGSSCSVSVTYAPSTFAQATGNLVWTDNTARGSHAAALGGDPVIRVNVTKSGSGVGTVAGSTIDCGATCAVDISATTLPPAVNLAATARVGSVFTGWSGPCTGVDACTIPFSSVTPTLNVTASFAPVVGAGAPALQSRTGFEAYRDGEAGCPFVPCVEPPDPAIGASATQVVTANNSRIRVTDRIGTIIADLPIWVFFAETAFDSQEQPFGGDPRVVWDAAHGRWLASEMSASCGQGHVYVGVSATADAAGDWLIYRWDTAAGTMADFPILGLSSDKVAVGYNLHSLAGCTPGMFQSSVLLIAPLGVLLGGGNATAQRIVDPQLFGFAPAADPTRASITVLGLDLSSILLTDPTVVYLDLAGSVGAARFGPRLTLPGAVLGTDPPRIAAISGASGAALDGRITEVSVVGGRLRFATTISCTPAGDTLTRACARLGTAGLNAGFAAWMDNTQNVVPGVNTAATAVASVVPRTSSTFSLRITAPPPYGLPGYGSYGSINFGAKGAEGPKMFDLPCAPATASCSVDDMTWTGTLTTADFHPSAQVPTYASAMAAMQAGTAYIQLYSGSAEVIRGQFGPGAVVGDRYQESIIGSPGTDTFLPAIGGSTDGTTYVTVATSKGLGPISTAGTWAGASDARGTFHALARLSTGGSTYVGSRWGDYATIATDPANSHAVWQAHEAVTATGDWFAWSSQLLGSASTAPAGTIAINGGAASTVLPEIRLQLTPKSGSGATEALVSDSPTLSGGLLAKRQRLPLGVQATWSLIDPALGGTATTGTKTVYVQWGNGAGTWSSPATAGSITLLANPAVSRLAGTDRYSTAAAISAANFQPGAPVVFIATGLNFPDALAGAAVAGKLRAPILLVGATGIPPSTATELLRLRPDRIVLLGGPGVIPDATRDALERYATGGTTRIAGTNRYETAALIADSYFAPGVATAYIATGTNFPDALAGAAVAGAVGAPILLVSPSAIPAATAWELAYLKPGRIVILGGTGAVSTAIQSQLAQFTAGTVTRLAGADRYATAAKISASSFAPGVRVAFIATGTNFPDALAGAAVAGKLKGPVLLVAATSIPAAIQAELLRLRPGRLVILGGPGVVSDAIRLALGRFVVP